MSKTLRELPLATASVSGDFYHISGADLLDKRITINDIATAVRETMLGPLDADGDITISSPGLLKSRSDTDTIHEIGRVKIWGAADIGYFSHFDQDSASAYALAQTAAGDTLINAQTGQTVSIRNNNGDIAIFAASSIIFSQETITTGQTILARDSDTVAIGSTVNGIKLSVSDSIAGGVVGTSSILESVNESATIGSWNGTIHRWIANNVNTNQAWAGAILTSTATNTLSDYVIATKTSEALNTFEAALRIKGATQNVLIKTASDFGEGLHVGLGGIRSTGTDGSVIIPANGSSINLTYTGISYLWNTGTGGYLGIGTNGRGVSPANSNLTCNADQTVTINTTLNVDLILEKNPAAGVTIDGVLLKDASLTTTNIVASSNMTAGTLITSTISERILDAGVTIDGVLLKDNTVTASDITASLLITSTISERILDAGVTIDGVLIKDNTISAAAMGIDIIAVDVLTERNTGVGVTIDGVLLKDNDITTEDLTVTGDTDLRYSIGLAIGQDEDFYFDLLETWGMSIGEYAGAWGVAEKGAAKGSIVSIYKNSATLYTLAIIQTSVLTSISITNGSATAMKMSVNANVFI